MKGIFSLLACLLLILIANDLLAEPVAEDIIRKIEDNLNGKTAYMEFSMVVKTKRSDRTLKMESFSQGSDKSFIKILYPKKDKGITFLKLDNTMWQYVPRIEKTIKIPASMMLQSWMGSDFTNDDLVRESSISRDYQCRILEDQEAFCKIELLPRQEAAVVWGRIVMDIDKQIYFPTLVSYYDEDDLLIRTFKYMDVRSFGDKLYPSRWLVEPKADDKSGHSTMILIHQAEFDQGIDQAYFTKRALKRFSQ